MPGKRKQPDALATLLKAAPSRTVKELLARLAATRPEIRRECFEYLKKHAPLSARLQKQSEGEVLLTLWSELDPDLEELDEYGGRDYGAVDHVGTLLYEIKQDNLKRPVFHDEFAKAVPGWRELK